MMTVYNSPKIRVSFMACLFVGVVLVRFCYADHGKSFPQGDNPGDYIDRMYRDDDTIRWEEYFSNNILEKHISYYGNGKKESDVSFKGVRNQDGPFKRYYENGNLLEEGQMKDGQMEGTYRRYYDNGKLKLEIPYHNGSANGTVNQYYSNGQLMNSSTVNDGMVVDGGEFYNEDGSLVDGHFALYYDDGRSLRFEGDFKHGKADGEIIQYYSDGSVNQSGEYKNGKLAKKIKKSKEKDIPDFGRPDK